MKTIKELADIGAAAALDLIDGVSLSVSPTSGYWYKEEPARQAFAQAVRDAVLADLVTKSDSLPTTKTIPLDINDIRATDEFRRADDEHQICAMLHANDQHVMLSLESMNGIFEYATLAKSHLRRQHGSNEWKPCTKEVAV